MMTEETKPKRKFKRKPTGRPRNQLDLKLFKTLSIAGCSLDEIAAMLRNSGCEIALRTLKRRLHDAEYRDARDEGFDIGKANLRSNMVELSRLKNSAGVQMSIHLSKHWLGMSEKSLVEMTGKDGGPLQIVDLSKLSDEQITQLEAITAALAITSRDDGGDQGGEGSPV